jgi:hypothetical protein
MWNFLKDDNPSSEMRVSHFIISISVVIVIISVALYILKFASKGVEITHWSEMGIFILGIAGVATGTAMAKAVQKKDELSNKPPTP